MFLLSPLRRHKWKSIIGAVLVVLVGGGIAFAMRPKAPSYVTETAKRGDLRQTVEAVGTVISEKDLALQFRSPGVVAQVLVQEGDHVVAGQRLVTLRAGNLAAAVSSASARVQEMQAALGAARAGSRPEDIAIAEAQVANRRASLNVAKQSLQAAEDSVKKSEEKLAALQAQTSTNLSGEVTAAAGTITQKATIAQQALSVIDDVFANNDVFLSIYRKDQTEYNILRQQQLSARDALQAVGKVGVTMDYQNALGSLQAARIAVAQAADVLSRAYDIISALETGSSFTTSAQTTYKSTIATQRNAVQTALRDLDAAIASLQNMPASVLTQIAAEKTALQNAQSARDKAKVDIQTYQTTLQIEEAQLQLKRAGSRPEDIAASEARVRQAQADLARASADYGDTILTAPVAGVITQVSVKQGEASPVGPVVTMIGSTPYRVEMFVSEVDIPKVQLSQSGSVELDAFQGQPLALRVGDIDPAATIKDGVPKYRVKLDVAIPREGLRIGMTGDAAIVTGMRQDVVSIPRRAVLEENGERIVRILGADSAVEKRPVKTGMEGESGEVEVVSGVREGEVVIVLQK